MMGVIVLIFVGLVFLILVAPRNAGQNKGTNSPRTYPYKPGIEFRLPNGQITTKGYAAVHPEQFSHWQHGRHVMGEVIDATDWENWNVNYFGM